MPMEQCKHCSRFFRFDIVGALLRAGFFERARKSPKVFPLLAVPDVYPSFQLDISCGRLRSRRGQNGAEVAKHETTCLMGRGILGPAHLAVARAAEDLLPTVDNLFMVHVFL